MGQRMVWRTAIAGLAAAGLAASALAQTPMQPQPKDPNMPAPQNTVPEKMEPRSGDAPGSTGTLSDRLGKTDGVITPSDTSPSMSVPAPVPNPGTTPVIPPAGTPGSSQPDAAPK